MRFNNCHLHHIAFHISSTQRLNRRFLFRHMESQVGEVPANAPTSCPGVGSEDAGKASSCAGCPNQAACASGAAALPLEHRAPEVINSIRKRIGSVKCCLFILAGKGGVGKSSVSVCLARSLATRNRPDGTPLQIGVLDLDLCGPSIPCLMGCLDSQVHQTAQGWSPVFVSDNLALMSLGFLTEPDQAVIWRAPLKIHLSGLY